ncbi:unnamed protein product [Vitrella brassicaformis CCMP3155]|uniref:Rad4 beta-hairpin domain-containing protein n=1 Tax=Vitrella brassicaformis (strain CCMP3155) TaxID=1169540 RepID=A0A0G4GGJ3_VITBC|nr:unnamed protein product [Vitrella brassicaformis CCMP3155]|eukprot:CEM28761.1 unnamed protein product [Vitrella brassicaformis CCMP3155]
MCCHLAHTIFLSKICDDRIIQRCVRAYLEGGGRLAFPHQVRVDRPMDRSDTGGESEWTTGLDDLLSIFKSSIRVQERSHVWLFQNPPSAHIAGAIHRKMLRALKRKAASYNMAVLLLCAAYRSYRVPCRLVLRCPSLPGGGDKTPHTKAALWLELFCSKQWVPLYLDGDFAVPPEEPLPREEEPAPAAAAAAAAGGRSSSSGMASLGLFLDEHGGSDSDSDSDGAMDEDGDGEGDGGVDHPARGPVLVRVPDPGDAGSESDEEMEGIRRQLVDSLTNKHTNKPKGRGRGKGGDGGGVGPRDIILGCRAGRPVDITLRYVDKWSDVLKHRGGGLQQLIEDITECAAKSSRSRRPTIEDRLDDERLGRKKSREPLPSAQKDFKNHPLFALPSELNMDEAIHPRAVEAAGAVVGYFQGQKVYRRGDVTKLRTADQWKKEGRQVIECELERPFRTQPRKPTKKTTHGGTADAAMQEVDAVDRKLYGVWQTTPMARQVATNGTIPVNEYGNVDLTSKVGLPVGTVHLSEGECPGALRAARRLQLEHAPALVGFDYQWSGAKPRIDGVVVMLQDADNLREAAQDFLRRQADRKQRKEEATCRQLWRGVLKTMLARADLQLRGRGMR